MILFSFNTFPQSLIPITLKLTGELFYSRTPGERKGIKMTVKEKLPGVVLLASDSRNYGRPGVNQQFQTEKDQQAFLVAVPKLYNYTDGGSSKTFLFGRNSAENDVDLAVVRIIYQNAASTPSKPMNRRPLLIGVAEPELLEVKAAGSAGNDLDGKLILKAEATTNETVTIEIDREENRGNVIVGIFSQRTGNLVAMLDPKDPGNSSSRIAFTADETVLIIPVIRPRVSSVNGVDSIVFEVGDPREVATVEATEE